MICDVVIPVGPGHEEMYKRAADSVKIASSDRGCFDKVNIILVDDTKGLKGRSAARNDGVRKSEADYLFFLDADDLMHPLGFRNVSPLLETGDYAAIWGAIWEYGPGGTAAWRYQLPEITDLPELVRFDPYLTLQMGHFVQRAIAGETPFDESMDTGEDWDYYLRVWERGRCIKGDFPLFINDRSKHSHGPRAATGQDWRSVVGKLLQEKRDELEKRATPGGCGGAPGRRGAVGGGLDC